MCCVSVVSVQAPLVPTLLLALLWALIHCLPVVTLERWGFHRAGSAHNSCCFAIWSKSMIHLGHVHSSDRCWHLISPAMGEPLCHHPEGKGRGQGRPRREAESENRCRKVGNCVFNPLLLPIHQLCLFFFLAEEISPPREPQSCEVSCSLGESGLRILGTLCPRCLWPGAHLTPCHAGAEC